MENNFFKRASDATSTSEQAQSAPKKDYVVRPKNEGGFSDRGERGERPADRGGDRKGGGRQWGAPDSLGGGSRGGERRSGGDGFGSKGGFSKGGFGSGRRDGDRRSGGGGGFVKAGFGGARRADDGEGGGERKGGFGGGGFKKEGFGGGGERKGGFGGGGFKKEGFGGGGERKGGFKREGFGGGGERKGGFGGGGFKRDGFGGGDKKRFQKPTNDFERREQREANREERRVPENIIFGIHPIREALEMGGKLDKIYIIKEPNESLRTIETMALDMKIPVQKVPTVKLDKLSKNNNHQGVVATLAQVEYVAIEDVLAAEPTFILLLDGITDVRNFGAIARSAECAGVDAIIVSAKNGAQINGEAIKSSAGALLKIPVCRVGSLRLALETIKESGITAIAATEKGAEPIYDIDMTTPTAVVMGSEDKGISGEVLRLCDKHGAVPTVGTIESLNVSAAAAVILFEARRQRK